MFNESYTGKFTFKKNFWGSLILYIEMHVPETEETYSYNYWRKAKFTELPYLKFKLEL